MHKEAQIWKDILDTFKQWRQKDDTPINTKRVNEVLEQSRQKDQSREEFFTKDKEKTDAKRFQDALQHLTQDKDLLKQSIDAMEDIIQQASQIYQKSGEKYNYLQHQDISIATSVFQRLVKILVYLNRKYKSKKHISVPLRHAEALSTRFIKTANILDAMGHFHMSDRLFRLANDEAGSVTIDLGGGEAIEPENTTSEIVNEEDSDLVQTFDQQASHLQEIASELDGVARSLYDIVQDDDIQNIDKRDIRELGHAILIFARMGSQFNESIQELADKARQQQQDPNININLDSKPWDKEEPAQANRPGKTNNNGTGFREEPPPQGPQNGPQWGHLSGNEVYKSDWTLAPLTPLELIGKANSTFKGIGNRVDKVLEIANKSLGWLDNKINTIQQQADKGTLLAKNNIKMQKLAYLGGEYWIDDSGYVVGADDDDATGHVGHVFDTILGDPNDINTPDMAMIESMSPEELREFGLDDDQIAVLKEEVDPRVYAIHKWGWIAVRGNNVEIGGVSAGSLNQLASGLYDIYGDNPVGEEFNIEIVNKDGHRVMSFDEVPWDVIDEANPMSLRGYKSF